MSDVVKLTMGRRCCGSVKGQFVASETDFRRFVRGVSGFERLTPKQQATLKRLKAQLESCQSKLEDHLSTHNDEENNP